MIKQSELEAMSDFELEEILGGIENSGTSITISPPPQFCSSPEWIMPLVVKHNLSLAYDSLAKGYDAIREKQDGFDTYIEIFNTNPYRAAVIVLILLITGR